MLTHSNIRNFDRLRHNTTIFNYELEGGDAYVRGSGCTRDVRAMYAAI